MTRDAEQMPPDDGMPGERISPRALAQTIEEESERMVGRYRE